MIVRPVTSATIAFGGADSGTALGLTDAELDTISAGTVQVGSASAGAITFSSSVSHANNLSIISSAGFSGSGTLSCDKNLKLTAGAAISLTGAISVQGTTTLTSGSGSNIALNNSSNQLIGNVLIFERGFGAHDHFEHSAIVYRHFNARVEWNGKFIHGHGNGDDCWNRDGWRVAYDQRRHRRIQSAGKSSVWQFARQHRIQRRELRERDRAGIDSKRDRCDTGGARRLCRSGVYNESLVIGQSMSLHGAHYLDDPRVYAGAVGHGLESTQSIIAPATGTALTAYANTDSLNLLIDGFTFKPASGQESLVLQSFTSRPIVSNNIFSSSAGKASIAIDMQNPIIDAEIFNNVFINSDLGINAITSAGLVIHNCSFAGMAACYLQDNEPSIHHCYITDVPANKVGIEFLNYGGQAYSIEFANSVPEPTSIGVRATNSLFPLISQCRFTGLEPAWPMSAGRRIMATIITTISAGVRRIRSRSIRTPRRGTVNLQTCWFGLSGPSDNRSPHQNTFRAVMPGVPNPIIVPQGPTIVDNRRATMSRISPGWIAGMKRHRGWTTPASVTTPTRSFSRHLHLQQPHGYAASFQDAIDQANNSQPVVAQQPQGSLYSLFTKEIFKFTSSWRSEICCRRKCISLRRRRISTTAAARALTDLFCRAMALPSTGSSSTVTAIRI